MLHAFGADAEDVGSKSMLQHWHEVMGHLNFADLVTLASMTPGMPDLSKEKRYKCHCCMQAKALRKGHPKQARHRATKKMERLHIDFSGPFQIPSIGGARYLFVIVDDYSRNVAVYLTRSHSGAAFAECLRRFFAEHGNPETVSAVIRSDNAKEFTSGKVPELLLGLGIGQELFA